MLRGPRPRLWSCSCGWVWAAEQAAALGWAGSPGWGKAQHLLQRAAGLGHVRDPPLWFFSPRWSEGAGCRGGTGCSALQPTVLLQGQSGVCSTTRLMISVQSCPGIHSASAFLTSSISAASQIPITRIRCGWLVHRCRVEKASVFLQPDRADGESAGSDWCDTSVGSAVTLRGNRRGLGGEGWGRGKQPHAALLDHQSHPLPLPQQR